MGGLITGGGGAPRIFHRRRRRRGFMVGGVRLDERALKQRTRWTGVFFWLYRGQPLHLSSLLGRWRHKVNCEYACCAQIHSRNEFLEAHINAMLSVEAVENAAQEMWE